VHEVDGEGVVGEVTADRRRAGDEALEHPHQDQDDADREQRLPQGERQVGEIVIGHGTGHPEAPVAAQRHRHERHHHEKRSEPARSPRKRRGPAVAVRRGTAYPSEKISSTSRNQAGPITREVK
jgi:hypothetical protein